MTSGCALVYKHFSNPWEKTKNQQIILVMPSSIEASHLPIDSW